MGKSFLIDSNILSKQLKDQLSKKGSQLFEDIIANGNAYVSFVNRIELLSWKVDKSMERLISIFLKNEQEYPINEKVIEKTIAIRRNYKIKLPDAIIAATCLANKMVLLTDNEQDFNKIKGLKTLNPTKDF